VHQCITLHLVPLASAAVGAGLVNGVLANAVELAISLDLKEIDACWCIGIMCDIYESCHRLTVCRSKEQLEGT
jgi:hypothetical protein